MAFLYQTQVLPDWIDYNGHMQDAFYGLVFSYAVDAFQDWVGFDASYREATSCTIYLVEEHKYFLKEVKQADPLTVEIRLLGVNRKMFHLHCTMTCDDRVVSVAELMEMHVCQIPKPKAAPIPKKILERLIELKISADEQSQIQLRARKMGFSE